MMKIFILRLSNRYEKFKEYWQWRRVARKTHAQRRFDQLCMLIDAAPTMDRLYEYGELADEYEKRFEGEPVNHVYARALGHKIELRTRQLYRKLINL